MSWTDILLTSITALLAGTISAMGMGGGGILLLYLTAFAGVAQLEAQTINLIFFMPIAVIALIMHTKNKLVNWKVVLWVTIFGYAGVFLGYQTALFIGEDMLRRLFAVFLLFIGAKELFFKDKGEGEKPKRIHPAPPVGEGQEKIHQEENTLE